ncbi:MAG: ABC transporter ATP-binding protein [Chloroflexi bacterium]|nr:ABC transporter ATP-binding protein [Chloroflexota bacterium]
MNTPVPPNAPLISLRGLKKSFREGERIREVIQGVDADFADGECVALAGRSGSGKSTLLNLISGIDLPSEGEIVVSGLNIARLSEQERTLFRRKNIGFIYQFFNLIPTLTVIENVSLPLQLNGNRDRAEAVALLEEVGLADRARAYPDRLSGGEQQRVAIVRALVHDPLLLLADEPTGNLDAQTGRQIMELLDRLVRRAHKTLIIVTHSREVAGFADRLLTLEAGHLTEGGDGAGW